MKQKSGTACRIAPLLLAAGVCPVLADETATADGAGSQEWGTDPDIVSTEGETALETCLKAIRSQTAGK